MQIRTRENDDGDRAPGSLAGAQTLLYRPRCSGSSWAAIHKTNTGLPNGFHVLLAVFSAVSSPLTFYWAFKGSGLSHRGCFDNLRRWVLVIVKIIIGRGYYIYLVGRAKDIACPAMHGQS